MQASRPGTQTDKTRDSAQFTHDTWDLSGIEDDKAIQHLVQRGQEQCTEPSPKGLLTPLLSNMSAAFSRYPGHPGLISLAFDVLTLNEASFEDGLRQNRDETLPVASELLQNVLKSSAAIGHKPKVCRKAIAVVAKLLRWYPDHLPRACDINGLACLMNELLTDAETTFHAGRDIVDVLQHLSRHQLEDASARGVYKGLRHLLSYQQGTEANKYEPVVQSVSIFTAATPNTTEILSEGIHTTLLAAAKTFAMVSAIQNLIWNILALHCQEDDTFANKLLALGVLDAASHSLQQNDQVTTQSVLRFLIACSNSAPNILWNGCLEHSALMNDMVGLIGNSPTCCGEEDIANACGLLASMCECSPSSKAIEYGLVSKLEDCARRFPRTCCMSAIIGLLGSLNHFVAGPFRGEDALKLSFFSGNHHLFIKDMLSNSDVASNAFLVELIYGAFKGLLKSCPPSCLFDLWSPDFVSSFVISFARDVVSFPDIAINLVSVAYTFLYNMESKASLQIFQDLGFHTAVANVISGPVSQELVTETLSLLSVIVNKYYTHFKDLRPLLSSNFLDVIFQKVLSSGDIDWESASERDVQNILLKMTGTVEMAKELFKRQYMDKFLELLNNGFPPAVQYCAISCVANIALGGYEMKKVLMDRMIHYVLLEILGSGEPYTIEASCRLLHILALAEPFQHEFLEAGCVGVTLSLVKTYRSNPNVCCGALGFLAAVVTKAVRFHYASLDEVLEVVVDILKTGRHGRVLGNATLILLVLGGLDASAVRLRELSVHKPIGMATSNKLYVIQYPYLEKWGSKLLEELSLYTVGVSPRVFQLTFAHPFTNSTQDCNWPPCLPEPDATRQLGSSSDESRGLKPHFPVSVKMDVAERHQLVQLGMDTSKPVFRVGRFYGNGYGTCRNCSMEATSEELVIRPHSLTPQQYQNLIDNGWYRRGSVKMFRLRQNHSAQCCDWETRVLVKDFDSKLSKHYSKVIRRIPVARLTVQSLPTHFSKEAFNLYNEYNCKKHDKNDTLEHSYVEHVVDSVISNQTVDGIEYGTYHQMYRLDGKLVAVGLIDIVPKGIISAYMWYSMDKEVSKYSLGVYSALKEIEMVQELSKKNPEMKYYYLQGWNENNKKLAYKASYSPEEFYCACITPEWLPSLEAVKEAKQKYLQEHAPSSDVACSAFEKDRAKYEQLTGHKPDVSKIVVCLNYATYLHLGEMFSKFNVDQSQKELMERRFEELLVAIGPELGSQLVVDIRICPFSGEFL